MSENRIRVLIADDHAIVRKGIRAVLATESDIVIVGETTDGKQTVEKAEELHPDIVLMDLAMPVMDGLEAIRQIAVQNPGTRVLVLTSFSTDDKVFPAIKAGALGYLLKGADADDLVQAIRQVYRGEAFLHPAIARKVLKELNRGSEPPAAAIPLTGREVEVLRLVAQGLTNHEIADRLTVSEATVHSHVSNLLGKLHLASRTQAALYALREGIASLENGKPRPDE